MPTRRARTGKQGGDRRPRTTAARRPTRKPPARRTAAETRRKRRREPETLRLRAIVPSLTVDDLDRSIRFYTDVLGFIVGERWEEGGQLRGVMLRAGGCEIGLSQDDWAKGRDRKKGEGARLWCQTAQDIDALAARIRAVGGRLTQEPRDEMGGRHLGVDDPDGYHLSFENRG